MRRAVARARLPDEGESTIERHGAMLARLVDVDLLIIDDLGLRGLVGDRD